MMRAKRGLSLAMTLACGLPPATALASNLIVLETRGSGYKVGQAIPSDGAVKLGENERLILIASDGRTVALRGPFSGPPIKAAAGQSDPKLALAALIATRSARASVVGVSRSGEQRPPLRWTFPAFSIVNFTRTVPLAASVTGLMNSTVAGTFW